MTEVDPYQAWLDDFKREIDALAAKPLAPSREAGRNAQAAFSTWWQSELEPVSTESPSAKEPPPSAGQNLASRLEALAQERSSLKAELALAKQENGQLREALGESRTGRQELEAQIAGLKEAHQNAEAGFQDKARVLEDQIQTQRQDKAFIEKAFERLEVRAHALEADLRQASVKDVAVERDALDARRRLGELEPELQRLKEEAAAAQATIAELRRQTSSYNEKVVDFQEHTGSDVAMLRQELREFLIKVKRLVDEAAGRQS
jgi:predicted  nucleic acid-binding Zn-ribbon protein